MNESHKHTIINDKINTLIKNYDIQQLKKVLQGYYTFENDTLIIHHSIENIAVENSQDVNHKNIETQEKPIDISQFNERNNPIIFLIEYYSSYQYLSQGEEKEEEKEVVSPQMETENLSPTPILSKDQLLELMTLLLQYTSDLNFETIQGQLPLFVAFSKNQVDILKLFFQYFIPNTRTVASMTSTSPFSKIPLNLNIFNEEWENVLLYTFKRLNDLPDPTFSFLLNFDLSSVDREGRLLEETYRLDLNAQAWNGKTLIMLAVERCNYDFLKRFFKTIWSVQCRSILQILCRCKNHCYYDDDDMTLHPSTSSLSSPISSSSHSSSPSTREDMIKNDLVKVIKSDYRRMVDLEVRDMTQNTALLQAIWSNHLGIVKCLLFHGAKVNVVDGYGHTPLMIASLLGRVMIAKLLMAYGADSTIQSREGQTALDLADRKSVV